MVETNAERRPSVRWFFVEPLPLNFLDIEEIVPILVNAAQAIAGNDALVMSKQLQDVLAGRVMCGL